MPKLCMMLLRRAIILLIKKNSTNFSVDQCSCLLHDKPRAFRFACEKETHVGTTRKELIGIKGRSGVTSY